MGEERILSAALAGLKFANSRLTQALENFIPGVLNGRIETSLEKVAAGARELALAGEPTDESSSLTWILSRVELGANVSPDQPVTPAPLSIDEGTILGYDPWKGLRADLERWRAMPGWEAQGGEAYLMTGLALIRRHLSRVGIGPEADVSLYDHARLTSALAACLAARRSGDGPVALLARADLSGIQKFIYRITRPEAETEHVAKRLRGRSFYLTLLMEAVADWLLREIGVPAHCAQFVGGGRFDLLLPADSAGVLTDLMRWVSDWLLREFQGEVSLHFASSPLSAVDLADMRTVYRQVDEHLEDSKKQKWLAQLTQPGFFEPQGNQWHVCRICRLTPLLDPGICGTCVQHERIGQHLPYATHLAWGSLNQLKGLPTEQVIVFRDAPFTTCVGLIREPDNVSALTANNAWPVLQRLNQSADFLTPQTISTFRFLANQAPRALNTLSQPGMDPILPGNVLTFEALAGLSQGAARLGMLKADVDLLGLIMSEGLVNVSRHLQPTLARVSTLSGALDLFFAGHLNRLCREGFVDWQATTTHPWANQVDGLFYIVYSGGDDLLLVGPWDAVLNFALRLRRAFTDFTGKNPSLTLSAGFVQAKPRYPVQKFAELVDEAERLAKNAGRNRVATFGQVLEWEGDDNSFAALLQLAADLAQAIEAKHISRGLIVDLGEVHRQHTPRDKPRNPMWTPRLYYTLARRLSGDAYQTFGPRLLRAMRGGRILVPVSMVSLSTRKE